MTQVITAVNVNDAFIDGMLRLKLGGVTSSSRNGMVIRCDDPVVTTYLEPRQRVLWWKNRDANPFFHLMECIWMIAGENEVEWLAQFNARMIEYAEANGHLHGAYGFRWRMNIDQVSNVINMLREDSTTRRAVIAMWNPELDLNVNKKDLPCNTHIYFDVVRGALNMTVCCRSNDIIWGAYGANAVHFSFLHQLIAEATGLPIGVYNQFSNNFHAYLPLFDELIANLPMSAAEIDEYRNGTRFCTSLLGRQSFYDFCRECRYVLWGMDENITNDFLLKIVLPMRDYYLARKADKGASLEGIVKMPECDWKLASLQWVERRNNVSK